MRLTAVAVAVVVIRSITSRYSCYLQDSPFSAYADITKLRFFMSVILFGQEKAGPGYYNYYNVVVKFGVLSLVSFQISCR